VIQNKKFNKLTYNSCIFIAAQYMCNRNVILSFKISDLYPDVVSERDGPLNCVNITAI
jgi:hypothetical protein